MALLLATALAEAGQRMPDVVANLKYAGTWGSFQVSGALHQQRSNVLTPVNIPGLVRRSVLARSRTPSTAGP